MGGDWSEAPAVLDVGCGRGLFMNTAALAIEKVRLFDLYDPLL